MTIIVLLILAGVSLNAIVGENGIITNSQRAKVLNGMASLEEWLQEEYVKNYDSANDIADGNLVTFLNSKLGYSLLLREGNREYIINEGKVYYLLNKQCEFIPQEIREGLVGGDSQDELEYTRLQDVYGITKDLKVFYCGDGLTGTVYGNIEKYNVDPNATAGGIKTNTGLSSAIKGVLFESYGINVEDDVTLANALLINSPLEIDGTKYSEIITNVNGIGDLKSLKKLTLSNLNLTDLSGIEGITGLEYLYLKNTTVQDFSVLANCVNLKYLYIYLPSSIDETTANDQVVKLGEGMKNASRLTKLQYFGISGSVYMFDDTVKNMDNPATTSSNNLLLWTDDSSKSNVSSLGMKNGRNSTGLYAFNESLKKSIEYVYLNNNSFDNVGALEEFSEIVELHLMNNSSLTNVNGLSVHSSIEILTLTNCNLSDLGYYGTQNGYYGGLTGCSNIAKLSVTGNKNLGSILGIESASNSLIYLCASDCDLTEVNSLKDHSEVVYLNLANNVNLDNVMYIQHCKSLKYIYLDNNLNMGQMYLVYALNGDNRESGNIGTDVLIKQCINGINNIPDKYKGLFELTSNILPWNFTSGEEKLTIESQKWIALGNRKDANEITKLNLENQTDIQMEDKVIKEENEQGEIVETRYLGLKSTLKKLTGLKALKLKGCTQVDDISFIEGMTELYELNLIDVSKSLVDLSVIDNCSKLNRIFWNNPSLNAQTIVPFLNRVVYETCDESKSWEGLSAWTCSGFVCLFEYMPSFKNVTNLTKFDGGNMIFGENGENKTFDLSGTGIKSFTYRSYFSREIDSSFFLYKSCVRQFTLLSNKRL